MIYTLRTLVQNGSFLLAGWFPIEIFKDWDPDIVKSSKTADEFLERRNENETGWDRLYLMFSMDEFNNTSPELASTVQSGFLGLFGGACYGGFIRSRTAYMDFMERNQATAFQSHLDAKKKLQDAVTLSFAKGAFQWGWRLGLFTFSYVGFTTAVSVYRGENGILEYVAAGAITGGLYKFTTGPRAMFVGGLLGAGLGSVAGVASYGISKLTGMSMKETRYWQYQWKQDRNSQIQKAYQNYTKEETSPLENRHNLASTGATLEQLEKGGR